MPKRGETRPVMERLLAKVEIDSNGCWIFRGSLNYGGYGNIYWDGRVWMTHRVTYAAMIGPIPEGLEIDHLCRVRACCNPDHLEPVTRIENQRRGYGLVGNALRKNHCPQGHEFTADNTYLWKGTVRVCRICTRAKIARYKARKATAA